ncbi:redoxin domain-containing protein [Calditerricola satsumensis]|uniref:Thiol-disulfide oxidoreductase YkuV n=1 Tax=Calditerricola satsumensis TaxID=373054 RepID=A0A8J3B8A3_9BACI|nr:redoxin domain-containing protein [Calditerricola satsumensis]GGJ96555.1 thiol-disulfide oxidoreductase YkuV [Calditerricola satsumensis]
MKLRDEMPEFVGVTEWVNGSVTKEELRGSPVLVHFWAISCHLCKESLPMLNEWREKYKDHGLKIVGVHMPRSEKDTEIGPVKETIAQYNLQHPIAIDNQHAVTDAFENQYVPAFYLFDQDLKLRHFQAGEKGLKLVQRRLHRILGIEETEA